MAKENIVVDDDELVEIMIPFDREHMDDVFVSLNGRAYQIKRGENVKVPKGIKAILDNSQRMKMEIIKKQVKLSQKTTEM